jgi:hypothetical protein
MPLRGLGSFAESEREVFYGRTKEREELARLVTGEGFRAGLLYGEAGVGKTSLLRAGLVPDLRDQGVVALYCEDNLHPLDSFARSLATATGMGANDNEAPAAYLARVIGDTSQIYLFILDDIELAMAGDERVATALTELFSRVVTRARGRARFLFSCASERVHRFAALEQRTGSLFPPNSRYELPRMEGPDAMGVLQQSCAQAGIQSEDGLARTILEELLQDGGVLPCDLQIAIASLKEQGITSPTALAQLGGYRELERLWVASAARATGNERSSMRLLGVLASGPAGSTCPLAWVSARASVEPAFARDALTVLQTRGIVQIHEYEEEPLYSLCHEVLAPRVREQSAPAKLSARHAFEALGAKVTLDKPLNPLEYLALRREGIVPTTPQEQAVISRTRLLGKIAIGVAAAIPLIIILIAYSAMSGAYYLDTATGKEGVETIVVRAGKPSMSWFNWLPKSPGFGSLVADSGLTERMVSKKAWKAAADNDSTGDLEGGAYAKQTRSALQPRLGHLVDYALKGEASALEALQGSVTDSDDFASLLHSLAAIAKASPEEVALIASALKDPSAAVQTEALMVAAASAQRKSGNYAGTLAKSLASSNAEHRRLAFSVVRTLDAKVAAPLYQAAIGLGPEPAAQRELQAMLSGGAGRSSASAASATSLLLGEGVSEATRNKAHSMLERAFGADRAKATDEAAALLGSSSAALADRIFAISLLLEYSSQEGAAKHRKVVETAVASKKLALRAAALPLMAHIDPANAPGELGPLLEGEAPPEMQVAAALAWGQVARHDDSQWEAAKAVLERLLKSQRRDLRAAAASAYGYTGRTSQEALIKMIKVEFIDVAEAAAYGLVNSTEEGASVPIAIGGIRDMWKRKGRLRRIAAEVYAKLARSKPGPAYFYVSASARANDDNALHAIGMRGLCNSLKAGNTKVGRDLARAAANPQVDVRRIAIQCVVDHPKYPAVSVQVASAMVDDSNGDIRAESARVLAKLAEQGESKEVVGTALSKMTRDDNRGVRIVATRALAHLGTDAPASAIEALPTAFDRGDEAEKLAILEVAMKIGATELVQRGIADASPLVRIAALDASIGTGSEVSAIVNSALTDSDTAVRRAALERLSEGKHGLPQSDVAQALALAIRDEDASISDLALLTNARVGDPTQVSAGLGLSLQSRSEVVRARAAAASLGLVSHSPKVAVELLTPLLADPSHDVRVAMLEPLAAAYAATMSTDELGKLLRSSESRANRRLAATAAFLLKAKEKGQGEEVAAKLKSLASRGPGFAKQDASLAENLLAESADGIAFLRLLVP